MMLCWVTLRKAFTRLRPSSQPTNFSIVRTVINYYQNFLGVKIILDIKLFLTSVQTCSLLRKLPVG
jgi:hypothetical protein